MKTFTLEEANALLPVVESLLGQVIAAKEEAERLESEIQSLRQRIFLSGGMTIDIAGVARNRTEGEAQVQRAKEVLAEMDVYRRAGKRLRYWSSGFSLPRRW